MNNEPNERVISADQIKTTNGKLRCTGAEEFQVESEIMGKTFHLEYNFSILFETGRLQWPTFFFSTVTRNILFQKGSTVRHSTFVIFEVITVIILHF